MKLIFLLLSITVVLLLNSCHDDDDSKKERYLEGEQIPGVEIHIPMGLYYGEPWMPKISPDGKKLLYTDRTAEGNYQGLWVVDLVTRRQIRLYEMGVRGDWSPDSQWIAFNIGSQIFKIKIDGTGLTQLTHPITVTKGGFTDTSSSFDPDWNPDGQKIAYDLSIDYRTGLSGTMMVSANGDSLGKIFDADEPDWSHDGNSIIGIVGAPPYGDDINFLAYDLNRKETLNTLSLKGYNQYPKYSPDDKRVIYFNTKGIYIINTDGTSIKRIEPNHLRNSKYHGTIKLYTGYPSWHPDGQHIIYEHFAISKAEDTHSYGVYTEGILTFYKVNVDSAIAASNLEP